MPMCDVTNHKSIHVRDVTYHKTKPRLIHIYDITDMN